MDTLIQIGLSTAMIIGPVIGYVDQYFIIKKTHSSAGFNSKACAILLFANILRIFFWIGKRFETTLLLQSILMIITMLILLKAVVRYKQDYDVLQSDARSSMSDNSIQEELRAEEEGRERRHHSMRRAMKMPFWTWNDYLDYIVCLCVFVTVLAILFLFLGEYSPFIEILGALSLGIESTLPLPQCISNYRNKSTKGFSLLVLATWFFGDSFKLFYFIYKDTPLQFIICGGIQLSIDTLIVIEYIIYSPYMKRLLHVNHYTNDRDDTEDLLRSQSF